VRLYDRLFQVADPAGAEGDFTDLLNPGSLETLAAFVEPGLADAPAGSRYQFERLGYFCSDSKDSAPGRLVFNRVVSLRDSWSKTVGKEKT
jgi:glutaminyl-tRNA synthetase